MFVLQLENSFFFLILSELVMITNLCYKYLECSHVGRVKIQDILACGFLDDLLEVSLKRMRDMYGICMDVYLLHQVRQD